MADNPHAFHVVPMVQAGPVDPTLIPQLEALLEQVRSGEVTAVAYVAMGRDGSVTTAFSPPYRDNWAMFGALERLKLRFYAAHIEEPGE